MMALSARIRAEGAAGRKTRRRLTPMLRSLAYVWVIELM